MKNLSLLFLSSVALATFAFPAFSADLPTHKGPPPAPVMAAPFSWTGLYGGIQGGYGWGAESDDLSSALGGGAGGGGGGGGGLADHFNVNGAIGGVHLGYNYQFSNVVLGALAEIDASGMKGGKTGSFIGSEGLGVGALSLHNSWQAFALARAGLAFDRILVYATGGLAIADDRESYFISDPSSGVWTGSQTKTLYGWAIGGGVEWAFSDHWSLNTEVRYADFGKANYAFPAAESSTGASSYKAGFNETTAEVGLSYHF